MNKTTQEVMESINVMIEFRNNIDHLLCNFPESGNDIEIIDSYLSYEIKKTLKDIIHIERL
jgi:hypothetical protein